MHFLVVENVVKKYKDHLALNNVSINVGKGKIFGLLGPNGAGKTSLIRIINQIMAPDNGKIFFNGNKMQIDHISQIGYLPEERGLYKKMKVGEQALYLTMLKGLSRKEALKRLRVWFKKLEIHNWWDKKVEELSKGMQQKIQFIVTVSHNPSLLIFDEPFSGFDPINTTLLKNEILNLRDNGATVIFSTHNMSSVEEICDDIALINQSKKVLEGPIDEIRSKYKSNIFNVTYLGSFNKMAASLSADYKILGVREQKNEVKVCYHLLADISINDFITNIMKFGTLTSFAEKIPSMNDIFIKVVSNDNHSE